MALKRKDDLLNQEADHEQLCWMLRALWCRACDVQRHLE